MATLPTAMAVITLLAATTVFVVVRPHRERARGNPKLLGRRWV